MAARTITVPSTGIWVPRTFAQDSSDKLDYGIDWTRFLAAGETISASVWTVPDEITKSGEGNASGVTSAFVTGGTVGETYEITNKITTSAGRIKSITFRLTIEDQ